MADINHVFGMYNSHEDIWNIFRLADNIFNDDIVGRINMDTILLEGTKWAAFDSDLGFTRCIFGSNTLTSGAFRFVTDVDNNGNLHLKVNMYSDPDDPDDTPALTYCDYNMGDKNDVLWFSMAWQMPYKSIVNAKVVYQRAQGEIVVTANDATLKTVIVNNFGYMHCVTGLEIDPDATLALDDMGGAYQFSVGNDQLPFRGYGVTPHKSSEMYPAIYKSPSTGVITDATCTNVTIDGRIQPALQNYCYYFNDMYKSDMPFGHSVYMRSDGNLIKYIGSDVGDRTQYNHKIFWEDGSGLGPLQFTLKGSGHVFYLKSSGGNNLQLRGNDGTILAQTTISCGDIFPNSSASGYVNLWLGLRQSADMDTTEGIYKKICGQNPYTIFIIGSFHDWNAAYDDEGQSIPDSFFAVFTQNAIKLDSVGSTLWLVGHMTETDVDPEPPEEGKELEDEPIDPAENPTSSALDIGVISIFNPTNQEMKDLTAEMQQTSILDEITKYFKNSPLEGIMSCHVVPVDVTTQGRDTPHFGNVTFETEMDKVSEQYYTKNFGSIHIDKKFASFLDYAPYTRAEIYLPYIGYRQLDTDDIMDKDVGVIYNFDILTGAILAQVTVNGSVHYQYSGNAVMQFPLTAANHNHLITSIVGLVVGGVGVAAGAAAGGPVGVAAAVGMGASMAGNAFNAAGNVKPEIQHGGSFAMTNGFMSVKSPHLVMNRPVIDVPADFEKIQGRMSNKTKLVSECSGYTEYFKVDVNGIDRATDKEKEMIENILLGGFYA